MNNLWIQCETINVFYKLLSHHFNNFKVEQWNVFMLIINLISSNTTKIILINNLISTTNFFYEKSNQLK